MNGNSNEGCPNTREIIIVGRNPKEKKVLFFNPSCGQWDCPYCWEKKREEWKEIAMVGTVRLMDKGNMLRFITLTGRGYFTPQSSIHFMRKNWPKLKQRAQYLTNKWSDVSGTEWAYFLIPERHKSGKAHWHLIASTWLDSARWWKDTAHKCGFGYMAHVREIENTAQAGFYVTKYMTKSAGGVRWPKGFRRARTSGNWPRPKKGIPNDWDYEQIVEAEKFMVSLDCLALGWEIIDNTEHEK